MPLYDYVCSKCDRKVSRYVKLQNFDHAQRCDDCGGMLVQVLLTAPGLGVRSAVENARVYAQHNVQRHEVRAGGMIIADPVSAADQCRCGNCSAHRRTAAVTGVAEPGRGN